MTPHLRIARPVGNLSVAAERYKRGLGLDELGRFEDHDGFDGVMLGAPDSRFHLEFTCCRRHPIKPTPTPEDLLVFYYPEAAAWEEAVSAMRDAGFREVPAFNPYWAREGRTFEDDDGYRVVIQRAAWTPGGQPEGIAFGERGQGGRGA